MLLFQIVQKECEKDKYTKQMEGIFISLRNLNVIYGSWMVVEFDGEGNLLVKALVWNAALSLFLLRHEELSVWAPTV